MRDPTRPGEGLTAIVTGAARRIGAVLARGLAADGWHVALHYHASRAEAERLAGEIRAAGGSAAPLAADLADAEAAAALVDRAAEGAPPLGLLVNNASLFEEDRLDSLSAAALDRHHAVNLRAPALLCQAFARRLAATGGEGCIVNLLDNKLFSPNPDYLSYSLSKFALQGLTQMLAMELAPAIRVAGIAPGVALPSGPQSEADFARAQASAPLGRGCTPEQILGALRFILATPAFTGQTIVIDGGQALQRLPRDVAFLPAAQTPDA